MKKLLIRILIILIILAGGWWIWITYQILGEIIITTDKAKYEQGENPKISIENNLTKNICFSSCYPYYLEKNNGQGFESYQYSDCPKADLAENCLDPGKSKGFELLLDKIKLNEGLHRVAVPACLGCSFQESFRKDQWFYSNPFRIK